MCLTRRVASPEEDEEGDEDGADEDDELPAAEMKKMKKRNVTLTLERIDGSLGIAVAGNQVTAVHKNGAGEAAGLEIGDLITEVNGKDTHLDTFGSLLPKDKTKPIKLRVVRLFEARLLLPPRPTPPLSRPPGRAVRITAPQPPTSLPLSSRLTPRRRRRQRLSAPPRRRSGRRRVRRPRRRRARRRRGRRRTTTRRRRRRRPWRRWRQGAEGLTRNGLHAIWDLSARRTVSRAACCR